MDQLERDIRAMLTERASDLPGEYDVPAGLARRATRRRTTKMVVGAGAAVLVVGAITAGAIGVASTKSARPRVITSVPTTVPRPSPTTQGAGVLKPTTPPVAPAPAVAGIGCPTSSVTAPFDVAAPKAGTRVVPGLDRALVSRVRSYVGPRAGYATDAQGLQPDVVLGPKDWSCRVYRSNGGGAVMYVYPPSAQGSFDASNGWATSEAYAGPEVRVTTAVLGHTPDIGLACAVFASEPLVEQWMSGSGLSGPCAAPAGRRLTKLAAGVYSFVDPDGTGGVGVMRVRATTPALDGDFGIVTCRLTGSERSLCDAIIADYATRYPGSVPGAPTSPAAAGFGGIVTTSGRVGNLQFGKSTAADVRSTAGPPAASARGSFHAPGANLGDPALPDYLALGYDCTATATPPRSPLIVSPAVLGPYCATVYFINTATGTLAAFETISPKYTTAAGTTVGMMPADAQRREGKQLIPTGCPGSLIQLGSLYQERSQATAAEVFVFVGPGATDPVRAIKAESNLVPVGMLFC